MFLSGLAVFRRTIPQFRSFATKESGTVKWFDVKKGFGFIAPQDGGKDVFVHQTVIHANGFRSLAEGETVEFTVQNDETGRLKATLVTGPMGAFVQGMPKPAFSSSRGGGGDNYGFGGGGGRYSAPKMDDYDDQDWASTTTRKEENDFDHDDEPKSDNYNKN